MRFKLAPPSVIVNFLFTPVWPVANLLHGQKLPVNRTRQECRKKWSEFGFFVNEI
jgi:hypothetical protein